VSGRDVLLNGFPESEIMSPQTRSVVAGVKGVRTVRRKVLRETEVAPQERDLDPGETAQQREVQERIDHRLDNQTACFRADSAVLTPDGQKALDEISRFLSEAPSLRCEIRGYGDKSRTPGEGGVLALRRALATEDYLISKGIAEWRLSAHAFGSTAGAARVEPAEGRRSDLMIDLVVKAR
jgi:outer membrane protein OmpA-like peptidoglycan-associated protein